MFACQLYCVHTLYYHLLVLNDNYPFACALIREAEIPPELPADAPAAVQQPAVEADAVEAVAAQVILLTSTI